MSWAQEGKVYRKKAPCPHDEAVWDGNSDWPGLKCRVCHKAIPENREKDYEEQK